MAEYQCDNCGACCSKLIIEPGYVDALREPKLMQLAIDVGVTVDQLKEKTHCVPIRDRERRCCRFLSDGEKRLCEIYDTRPNECVYVQPGDAKCQQARAVARLPLLQPIVGKLTAKELRESCEEYGLDFIEWFEGVLSEMNRQDGCL